MADYDRSTGAPWSAADLEQLRILAAEGTAPSVIAVQLDRSEEAIAHRAAQDGPRDAPEEDVPAREWQRDALDAREDDAPVVQAAERPEEHDVPAL